jgi:hypothetical protein
MRDNLEPRGTTLDDCMRILRVADFSALSVGSKWNESHEADYPLSSHHLHLIYTNLHRPSDNMKWRDFLSIPKKHRRTRSKARSELDPIEASSEADLAVPRPTESTPDLRIGTSTLPTPDPLISGDQKPSGMRATAFQTIHLTILPSNIDEDPNRSVPSDVHLTVDPVAAHENKSTWKSTAYSTTKLAINMVKESSDVFPPLKSVVGGLSAILQHCDVRSISLTPPRP